MSSFLVGYLIGSAIAQSSSGRDDPPRYAWFNEKEFEQKLDGMYKGKCDTCPASFFEYAYGVQVSTDTRGDWDHTYRPWKLTPYGYSHAEDYQGLIGWDAEIRPSKEKCESAVRQFRQLQAEGIDEASIKTGWIFRDRILVTTKDGKKHSIDL